MSLTSAVTRAKRIPMRAEPRNMTRKFPTEPNTKAATDMSASPWCFRAFRTVLHGGQQQVRNGTCTSTPTARQYGVKHSVRRRWCYFVMTMDTASFSTLSPKTSMLRVGSTSRAWKMARVATGSTAEMRHPKAKLGEREEGSYHHTTHHCYSMHTHDICWLGCNLLLNKHLGNYIHHL